MAVRRADRKTLLHPRVGRLLMDCETLVTPDQGQQLLVLTPPDAEARERLELLRVIGIEDTAHGTGPDGRVKRPAMVDRLGIRRSGRRSGRP